MIKFNCFHECKLYKPLINECTLETAPSHGYARDKKIECVYLNIYFASWCHTLRMKYFMNRNGPFRIRGSNTNKSKLIFHVHKRCNKMQ